MCSLFPAEVTSEQIEANLKILMLQGDARELLARGEIFSVLGLPSSPVSLSPHISGSNLISPRSLAKYGNRSGCATGAATGTLVLFDAPGSSPSC